MQIDSAGTLYLAYYYRGSISTVSTVTGNVTPNYVIGLSYPVSISITSNKNLYVLGWNFPSYFDIIGSIATPIDYIIFDNIDIANYYGFINNLTQLLGGYYKYSLSTSTSSFTSPRYLDECGWSHLATNELMKNPGEMATSPDGTFVYFVDSENSTIRKMSTSSPYEVTTIAGIPGTNGYKDGNGETATFFKPQGIAIKPIGLPVIYVADTQNSTLRSVLPFPPYTVTTIAGKAGESGKADDTYGYNARFKYLQALAISPYGDYIYVADSQNFTIRRVTASSGNYAVITIAGIAGLSDYMDGGVGTSKFSYLQALVCSPDGNSLYVADTQNFVIRKVNTAYPYTTTTIAGTLRTAGTVDGNGTAAQFNLIQSLAISKDGSVLYIGDSNVVRAMTTASPYIVTTLAGTQASAGSSDGLGTNATFNKIQGMAMSKSGTVVYLSDTGSSLLRQVNITSPNKVTTLAGSPFTTGSADTRAETYPDDTMYFYINSINLSIGKQLIQQLPGGYLKIKKDISNAAKNRPILKLLEGDTNISSQPRVYYLKTGLIKNIPIHLLRNQDIQVTVDTKLVQKSLLIDYVTFTGTKLPEEYTLIVPQTQILDKRNNWNIKGPISKLISDCPFEFSINGEKLFDSNTSNVAQIENLMNVSTSGYINIFNGPMNMSRIRDKSIIVKNIAVFDSTSNTWSVAGSNVWAETFNVLHIKHGLAGLLFESSFYNFNAPSSYLIS
jgi:sugar lactone lactonase YvrE